MRYDQALRGTGYHTALLTTFSFDPTVFENVVLVGMRGRGCRNIAVVADRSMVNQTLSEIAPAPRAGTAYHLAKRSVSGAFHPKIVLQLGQKEGRLMIGSANLTGAGLVGNLEIISTILVSEEDRTAAPILAEALRYFESHTDKNDMAMRDVLSRARGRTPWLADIEPRAEVVFGEERVAFLTEGESAGVGERFREFVGDDVIQQLIVVSPYADSTLEGFSRLRSLFGMPHTSFVVDPHEHDFTAETFGAQAGASLHSSRPHECGGERPLHAKMIVACGARADYVLAGSANASQPGLFSRFGSVGNAEAGIVRTEPPGTAIDRLKLRDCLTTTMPLSELSLRRRAGPGAEIERTAPLDGGDFWIEHGFIFWRPPTGRLPADCVLRLTDGAGVEIVLALPVAQGDRWSVVLESDANAAMLRTAVVIFPDGSESAPVPIAALNQLQRNASPPISGAAGRVLADLESRSDIDDEDYERAMKLLALLRPDETRKRDITRKTDATEEADEGKVLPEEQFGEIAETPEGRQSLKTGPISEMRRLVNAFLGLGTIFGADDDDLDPLAAHIKNANTSDRGTSTEDGTTESNDARNDGGSEEHFKKEQPKPAKHKESMAAVSARADKLVGHVDETCRALARPDLDPLNLEIAIRIHLLINVFLSRCAPVGEKASAKHPILAAELPRSWIRILGRLIIALEAPLRRVGSAPSLAEPDEECVEALATIIFCAGLLLDAARTAKMPRAVVAQLEGVNASLARSTGTILAGKPAAEAAVRQKLPILAAKHQLVPDYGAKKDIKAVTAVISKVTGGRHALSGSRL